MRIIAIEWLEGIGLLLLLLTYPRVQRYLWMRQPIDTEKRERHEH